MRRSLQVGAKCSVRCNDAATSEKQRIGRLSSSCDATPEAALKAITSALPSSLPSAGTFPCSALFSEGNTFSASLCSTTKSGRLHCYVSSPDVFFKTIEASLSYLLDSTEPAQGRSTSVSSTLCSCLSTLFSCIIHYHHQHSGNGNGFLHLTLDRPLYVTDSQGSKSELIAPWNFTNGEISVYGTGRVAFTPGDSENQVFYLMEAAGHYFFACDKACNMTCILPWREPLVVFCSFPAGRGSDDTSHALRWRPCMKSFQY
ncbi:unnamed protein product [Taenia asiatica]|uniref:DUF3700 domain-containing protein n=1 Tax=Taenia asiatica TaxID=60517 RepID=A0A0R3WGB7_TAEAS|nr:unnamed protein product [Taenia asiatica]